MFSRIRGIIDNPLILLYMLPALLVSLTLHEWAHAYAAYKCGDPTARNMGRLTLNPIAHFDLFGFICLMLIGFGWAKPVPVNPNNFRHYRRDEIIVSLAGVTMNFVLMVFFALLTAICIRIDISLYTNEAFTNIMIYFMMYNLVLMLFNLIPIPPLDGSHILEIALRGRAQRFMFFLKRYGMWILIGLLWLNVLDAPLRWAMNTVLSSVDWLVGLLYGI